MQMCIGKVFDIIGLKTTLQDMPKADDFLISQLKVAEDVANKPTVMKRILSMAGRRVRRLAGVFVFFTSLKDNADDIRRLAKSYFDGRYRQVPWASVVKAVLGMLYFVSFVDVIPDFIPALGLLDDFVVIAWVVNAIRDDLDKFKAWEAKQVPAIANEQNKPGNS